MHFQADNVDDIKGKVNNPTMFKLAQIIVNNRYHNGDKRFFLYIHNFQNKIEGRFTKTEFNEACRQYLNANKKIVKEYAAMNDVSLETAVEGQTKLYYEQYYGNKR